MILLFVQESADVFGVVPVPRCEPRYSGNWSANDGRTISPSLPVVNESYRLREVVQEALLLKKSLLSGAEHKFIRASLEMSQQEFISISVQME